MSKPHRKTRTRIVRILALTALVTLVVSGCAKELPQTSAAENPKGLESQQAGGSGGDGSDASAPEPSPEPTYTVPEYSTDLDLTAEETKEAEEALLVLQRYIFLSERVMRNGGTDRTDLDEVAQDSALDLLEQDPESFQENSEKLFGQIETTDYHIYQLTDRKAGDSTPTAVMSACLPGEKWGIGKASEGVDGADMKPEMRMRWTLKKEAND